MRLLLGSPHSIAYVMEIKMEVHSLQGDSPNLHHSNEHQMQNPAASCGTLQEDIWHQGLDPRTSYESALSLVCPSPPPGTLCSLQGYP